MATIGRTLVLKFVYLFMAKTCHLRLLLDKKCNSGYIYETNISLSSFGSV